MMLERSHREKSVNKTKKKDILKTGKTIAKARKPMEGCLLLKTT
jgi:hypothetical protein